MVKEKSEWLDETVSNSIDEYDDHYKALNRPLEKIKKRMHEYFHRETEKKKAIKGIEEYKNLT